MEIFLSFEIYTSYREPPFTWCHPPPPFWGVPNIFHTGNLGGTFNYQLFQGVPTIWGVPKYFGGYLCDLAVVYVIYYISSYGLSSLLEQFNNQPQRFVSLSYLSSVSYVRTVYTDPLGWYLKIGGYLGPWRTPCVFAVYMANCSLHLMNSMAT